MNNPLKRTWAEIDLDALTYNYHQIKQLLSPSTRFCAVVKADAYGHGDLRCAHALDRAGADWFAVSNLIEGIRLRGAGIEKPILILGYTPAERAADLCHYELTQTVYSLDFAKQLSAALNGVGSIDIHIKIDTGMSRLGFFGPDAVFQIAQTCSLPNLHATGIFTHFTSADGPTQKDEDFTALQHQRFVDTLALLKQQHITFEICHCCNSAATMLHPNYHMDMVRPGLILYGVDPTEQSHLDLRPVMRVKSVISMLKEKQAGEYVSYGNTYQLPAYTKIATIPVGYADGYQRALSNKGKVVVNNQIAPVIGRICMDQMMVDVTGIDCKVGDEVILFGTPKDGITAWQVANICDTIPYELLCILGKRVPRVYLKKGKIQEVVDYTL